MADLVSDAARRAVRRERLALKWARDPHALVEAGHVQIATKLDDDTLADQTLVAYDYQEEMTRAWVDVDHLAKTGRLRFRDTLAEKSRQMGLSWWTCWLMGWAVSYHDVRGLAVSLKVDEVCDSGPTIDSLFGRCAYMLGSLPPVAAAPAFHVVGGNSPRLSVDDRRFVVGEGQGANPGRGGTFAFAVLDEAAFLTRSEQVMSAVGRACPRGKFLISSPNGRGGAYYRLRRDRPERWRFLRMHWTDHPTYGAGAHEAPPLERGESVPCSVCGETHPERVAGKVTSPWYEDAISDMTAEEAARELDIDYAASVPHRVYPEWSELRHAVPGHHHVVRGHQVVLGWDFGLDVNATVICQDMPTEFRVLALVETNDATPDMHAAEVAATLRLVGRDETNAVFSVGDPAGEARSLSTGTSLASEYARCGFPIASRRFTVAQTVTATKRLLMGRPKPVVVARDGPGIARFVEHIGANRWPTNAAGERRLGASAPHDDEHNHALRAFAYLVSYLYPPADAAPRRGDESRRGDGRVDAGVGYEMHL